MTSNEELAARLEEMADLLDARDVDYKPNAYRRAADSVREQPGSVADMAAEGAGALEQIDGVGEAIAEKLVEYVGTGTIEELDELREELPVDMGALTSVEGVGPKTVGTLYEELGIRDLDDLENAASEGRIQDVSGFGAKTEQNILDGIPFARQAGDRLLLGQARPVADETLAHLRSVDGAEAVEVAGSIRRWKETIGDVDVLVASEASRRVVDRLVEWAAVDDVIEAGDQKASVRVEGVRIDLRVVVPQEFGSALQYFTGNKDHNVHVRNIAIRRELKMNEYGVFDVSDVADDTDQRAGVRIAGDTEASMYAALDLPLFPPEIRRNTGEIEAAQSGTLPDLIEEGAVRGDLHTHSDWSDGEVTIEEMVAAAAEFGYDYHCVSDHAAGAGTPPSIGLTDEELRDQMVAVADVAESAEIEVFHGVEANVDADGAVGVGDDVLAELDLVVASPHAALGQDAESATERLVRAVEHPSVDVLGHPSGRKLNERAGLSFDVERVAEAAAASGTALEINSNPHRLDLWGDAVQTAVETGALVAINTDAHSPATLEYVRYGVHTARRGWAEEPDVLNARDSDGVREFLH